MAKQKKRNLFAGLNVSRPKLNALGDENRLRMPVTLPRVSIQRDDDSKVLTEPSSG